MTFPGAEPACQVHCEVRGVGRRSRHGGGGSGGGGGGDGVWGLKVVGRERLCCCSSCSCWRRCVGCLARGSVSRWGGKRRGRQCRERFCVRASDGGRAGHWRVGSRRVGSGICGVRRGGGRNVGIRWRRRPSRVPQFEHRCHGGLGNKRVLPRRNRGRIPGALVSEVIRLRRQDLFFVLQVAPGPYEDGRARWRFCLHVSAERHGNRLYESKRGCCCSFRSRDHLCRGGGARRHAARVPGGGDGSGGSSGAGTGIISAAAAAAATAAAAFRSLHRHHPAQPPAFLASEEERDPPRRRRHTIHEKSLILSDRIRAVDLRLRRSSLFLYYEITLIGGVYT